MKRLLPAILLFISGIAFAQKPLSKSERTSKFKYVYRLTPEEAIRLYKTRLHKVNEVLLHSLVDSFPVKLQKSVLQTGNYLLVHADGNILKYELITEGDVQMKVVNNYRDLAIALHDNKGKLITNATVNFSGKKMSFDPATATYRIPKYKKNGTVEAVYANTAFYFPLEGGKDRGFLESLKTKLVNKFYRSGIRRMVLRWKGRSRYNYEETRHEQKFKGYLVFNKPKYKPGDTVRLKAFVTRKGKGIRKALLVRLTNQYFDIDTILATIKPYRRGGYTYEFVLDKSLDVDLDERYTITLEELRSRKYDLSKYDGDLDDEEYAAKRKVVMRGNFDHEEYELGTITFTARANKTKHYKGEEVSLFLKAVDENNLPVLDGRYEITLRTGYPTSVSASQPDVFIPDTLWQHSGALDPVGETKLNLPLTVFPAASLDYTIEYVLLNSNNERQTSTGYMKYFDRPEAISFIHRKDSLIIDYREKGQAANATATIYITGTSNDDTIQVINTKLPAAVLLNPFATSYRVKTEKASGNFTLNDGQSKVSAMGSRTKDSIFILLYNPHRLKVWYTIFEGKKPIRQGHADSLYFGAKANKKTNYSIATQFVYGNQVFADENFIVYKDKELKLTLHAPEKIFPGQQASVEVDVKDVNDKPVEDADVTAFSFTSKFENANFFAPYLGKDYKIRKRNSFYNDVTLENPKHFEKLNWERWSRELGLDSIEYYKFLFTRDIYRNKEMARDSITQIAPFVVKDGQLLPIHLIYIDEKPVYFSKSEDLNKYSFPINHGRHHLKIRTQKQEIIIKEITFDKGVKTILSIHADTSNKLIEFKPAPDTLTKREQELLVQYTILVQNIYGERMNYVEQGDRIFLLPRIPYETRNPEQLIGPLSPDLAEIVVKDEFSQTFQPEGGYIFQVTPGLVKQKEVNTLTYMGKKLGTLPPALNFKDLVLTATEIDSLWKVYLDQRSMYQELFENNNSKTPGSGLLKINLDEGKTVKNIFLFRYDNTDFIHVYKGEERDLGYLQEGKYRLLFLLKEDRYFLRGDLEVKKNGINIYTIRVDQVREKDSLSERFSRIIRKREIDNKYDRSALDSLMLHFNSGFTNVASFTNMVSGRIADEQGNPVPFGSISLRGTRHAVQADAYGNYRIGTPENGTLVFSATGYDALHIALNSGSMNPALKRSSHALQEVVVTAYGSVRRSLEFGFSSTLSYSMQGKVAGLIAPGASSLMQLAKPVIIIDGEVFKGGYDDIDPALIAQSQVLSSEAAVALYGSQGANGVLVLTTKKQMLKEALGETQDPANALRKNFRDHAYWQPKLRTGKDGKVKFDVVFPDDITSWRNIAIAVTDKKQTGLTETLIRSYKPVSTSLGLPLFAVSGDSINMIGKSLNYGNDSLRLRRKISIDNKLVKDGLITVTNSVIDTVAVSVPASDSLRLKFEITKEDGYYDGEERVIPVFKQGVIETHGFFAAMEGDSNVVVDLDPLLGKIIIHAEASLFPVLLDEAEKIRRYEYLCNEQVASKLKALLAERKIDSLLKKDFRNDKAIRQLIIKLEGSAKNNLWGWWPNNSFSPWISLHVTEALLMASNAGFKVDLQKAAITDQLVFNMEHYRGIDKLFTLHMLHTLNAKVDYKKYIDSLEKKMLRPSLYEKLRLIELKQKAGLSVSLDSMLSISKQTLFGNIYWGEDNFHLFDNSVQNSIVAYRILKAAGEQKYLGRLRNYFLEKRKNGQWRNTYESSLILETILPDLFVEGEKLKAATLTFDSPSKETVTAFPYHKEVDAKEKIAFRKTGSLPLYFTAYQQQWQSKPEAVSSAFSVNSFFEKDQRKISSLKSGQPVDLKVVVEVKGDADYVMIEVPIPAGCSYKEKPQPGTNNEVHREYFKEKVSIFCSSLKQGRYTFTIPLLPRYTGSFHLNPAKAELMYFPVFFGRDGLKEVEVR